MTTPNTRKDEFRALHPNRELTAMEFAVLKITDAKERYNPKAELAGQPTDQMACLPNACTALTFQIESLKNLKTAEATFWEGLKAVNARLKTEIEKINECGDRVTGIRIRFHNIADERTNPQRSEATLDLVIQKEPYARTSH